MERELFSFFASFFLFSKEKKKRNSLWNRLYMKDDKQINLQTPYEIKSPTCTRKHLNINITDIGKGNNRRWQAPGGQRVQRANSAGRFRYGCTRKLLSSGKFAGRCGRSPYLFQERLQCTYNHPQKWTNRIEKSRLISVCTQNHVVSPWQASLCVTKFSVFFQCFSQKRSFVSLL